VRPYTQQVERGQDAGRQVFHFYERDMSKAPEEHWSGGLVIG
jgi:hypothetical protein